MSEEELSIAFDTIKDLRLRDWYVSINNIDPEFHVVFRKQGEEGDHSDQDFSIAVYEASKVAWRIEREMFDE